MVTLPTVSYWSGMAVHGVVENADARQRVESARLPDRFTLKSWLTACLLTCHSNRSDIPTR